jgi:glycosyltransferase involved in cell wall biosynthesis
LKNKISTKFFHNEFLQTVLLPTSDIDIKCFPKISIVMPSFNQVDFIERSILSVLNQQYPNLQFIIIDGGSTDGTLDVIEKYAVHIDYWISEKDMGQSDALNKGFKCADGEIFGWLNSDDLYLPNAFFCVVSALYNHQDKSVVFGDWLSIDEQDMAIDINHAFDFSLNHFKYEGFHINAQSMFWRSDVHKRFDGFDVALHNTMDYQMILDFGHLLGDTSFLRVSKVLGAFRRYEGQKTGGVTGRVAEEHIKMAKRYGYTDKYKKTGEIKRLFYRFRRAYWYFKRGGIMGITKRLRLAYTHAR